MLYWTLDIIIDHYLTCSGNCSSVYFNTLFVQQPAVMMILVPKKVPLSVVTSITAEPGIILITL